MGERVDAVVVVRKRKFKLEMQESQRPGLGQRIPRAARLPQQRRVSVHAAP